MLNRLRIIQRLQVIECVPDYWKLCPRDPKHQFVNFGLPQEPAVFHPTFPSFPQTVDARKYRRRIQSRSTLYHCSKSIGWWGSTGYAARGRYTSIWSMENPSHERLPEWRLVVWKIRWDWRVIDSSHQCKAVASAAAICFVSLYSVLSLCIVSCHLISSHSFHGILQMQRKIINTQGITIKWAMMLSTRQLGSQPISLGKHEWSVWLCSREWRRDDRPVKQVEDLGVFRKAICIGICFCAPFGCWVDVHLYARWEDEGVTAGKTLRLRVVIPMPPFVYTIILFLGDNQLGLQCVAYVARQGIGENFS